MLCDNLHLPPSFPTTHVFFDYFTQVALVISIVYHILHFIKDSNNLKISILSLPMFNRDVFTTRTNLSYEPPAWRAWRIKFPYNMLPFSKFCYCCLIETAMCSSFSSLTAPLKFGPQSDIIVLGLTLLLMNLWSALIKETVSILSTSSKCIDLVTIHTNKQPHLFSFDRHCLMNIGPK